MEQKSIKEFETYLQNSKDPLADSLRALRELPLAKVRQRTGRVLGWIGWLVRQKKDKKK